MLRHLEHAAITAVAAGRIRLPAQRQLRGETRQRLAARAALLVYQQPARVTMCRARTPQLFDLRRKPWDFRGCWQR
jgi:hypothetical protein